MPRDLIPNIIRHELPGGVTYDLSWSDHILISVPPESTWSSGLHWHEGHTEYLKVVQGSIRVRVGSRTRIVSASGGRQPEIRIDKFVSHEWRRAEAGSAGAGEEEAIVMERWDPPDGEKTLLLRNVNGVMLEAPQLLQKQKQRQEQHHHKQGVLAWCPVAVAQFLLALWVELRVMVMFAHLDNIPVYVDLPSWSRLRKANVLSTQSLAMVDWVLSHLILSAAAFVGWIVGVQPVDERYTPPGEMAYWIAGRGGFWEEQEQEQQ
ncbi:hypothetical protein E4U43_000736 [Claviceps pusilla]|uniref:Uncharacterized protein n=1 Tax=Claviceps pusilla TaxID=123648 RepID=A0A9P7N929_9HYPO|nr:hypothetical protein E4U43_000736 [Claviceps pusilla]